MTADFRVLLALNLGTRAAGILMVLPVLGFRPFRAARFATEKVPNPTSETRRPFLSESRMAQRSALSDFSADVFVPPAAFAMAATRSVFVMFPPVTTSQKFSFDITGVISSVNRVVPWGFTTGLL